jgi:hypothetical protein
MTFVSLGGLLPKAFRRIDRKNILSGKKDEEILISVFQSFFPKEIFPYTLEWKRNTIIIYSVSQVLKQKIYITKEGILKKIRKEAPHIMVSDIFFKGPRA